MRNQVHQSDTDRRNQVEPVKRIPPIFFFSILGLVFTGVRVILMLYRKGHLKGGFSDFNGCFIKSQKENCVVLSKDYQFLKDQA